MLEHKEAMELVEDDWRADGDNRDEALEDLRFCAGDQWSETERTQREADKRPCLTINQMPKFVNQVSGDIRQAQPGIEVFPVDSQDDVATAKVYEGLIRQIEYQSGATSAYAHGVESSIRCGIGHWRLETEFTTDSVFEQEIKIKRIMDPLSVIWDSGSVEIDRSDGKRCWIFDEIHKNSFKERFKVDREGTDVQLRDGSGGLYWRRGDFIRIAEYWYMKPKKRRLLMLQTGETIDVTDMDESQLAQFQGQVLQARELDGFEVKRRLMDGQDWLKDEEDWAGRFIPVVPVLGSEIAFDGKIVRHGLIRFAKDPQRLYNLWRSAGAEFIGASPKAPWLVTPDMIAGYEGYWNNANRSNLAYLPYKADPNSPTIKPERQQPPTAPAAIWQEASVASDDMKNTTGLFDASVGAQSNETSGKAILARQREGDVGAFLYTDNFSHAMRRTGKILVDLIPRIYDTQRQVRILGVDGEEQFVPINVQTQAFDGQPVIVNDISHGRFDVRVKVGASYTTARVEAKEQMAQAMQNNPTLWSVIGDLFFKNSDYPGAEEISERLRRAVPPELLGEEAPQEQPDPMAEAAGRLSLEAEQAKVEDLQASTMKKQAETGHVVAQTEKTVAEAAAI